MVMFDRGFPAPDFEAIALDDGEPVSLTKWRGQYVLLNFWATWCPPCLEEMPSMTALADEFRAKGFEVVAISSDKEGAAIVQPFVDKIQPSFPIVLDPGGKVAKLYGATNLPVSFLIDPTGKVIAAAQGARDWASDEARSVVDEILNPK